MHLNRYKLVGLLASTLLTTGTQATFGQEPNFRWPQEGEVVRTRTADPQGMPAEQDGGFSPSSSAMTLPAPALPPMPTDGALSAPPTSAVSNSNETLRNLESSFDKRETPPSLNNSSFVTLYAEDSDNTAETIPTPPSSEDREAENTTAPSNAFQTLAGDAVYEACPPEFGFVQACDRNGIFFGTELTFLSAHNESNQSVGVTDLVKDYYDHESIETGLGGGLRGWVGLRSGNSGFIATGWGMSTDVANLPGPMNVLGGYGLGSSYELSAATLDLELFQDFCFHNSLIRATLGGRYATMERSGTTLAYGDLGNTEIFGLAAGASELDAWGVTFSLSGRTPIQWFPFFRPHAADYCGWNPWHFIWSVRGSALDSDVYASANTEAGVAVKATAPAQAFATDAAAGTWEGMIAMGTLQLGAEYRRPLWHRPGTCFVSACFEGQLWETGDIMAVSESYAYLEGTPPPFGARVESSSQANADDISLLGFAIRVGVEF